MVVSTSPFCFVWKRKWLQFTEGGTQRNSDLDTLWYYFTIGWTLITETSACGYNVVCESRKRAYLFGKGCGGNVAFNKYAQ